MVQRVNRELLQEEENKKSASRGQLDQNKADEPLT